MFDDDPILRQMSRLTVLSSDERRAEQLRARCRATWQQRPPVERRRIAPAILAGVCFAYLSALLHDILLLRRLF